MTSGPNIRLRRQVVAIADSHDLTLNAAFPFGGGGTYRVDNPLNTYTGPVLSGMESDAIAELGSVNVELSAILTFFNQIFSTPLVASGTGSVSGGGFILADATPDFHVAGVSTNDYVWVTTGPNIGVYQIASITNSHHLTTQQAFASTTTSLLYAIVSAFGCSFPTMQALYSILTSNTTFNTETAAWLGLLLTPWPVAGDAGASANLLLPSDVSGRLAVVQGRIAYLNDQSIGPIATIEDALSGTEKLYDKRYAWIDGRLNVQTGFLAAEALAITNRITAQANIVNQLLKLLAVQGGG